MSCSSAWSDFCWLFYLFLLDLIVYWRITVVVVFLWFNFIYDRLFVLWGVEIIYFQFYFICRSLCIRAHFYFIIYFYFPILKDFMVYFLQLNQLHALISQIYSWNETLHVSDTSSVHHQEFFTVHTAMVYVIQVCWQLASRIRKKGQFHPDPARRPFGRPDHDQQHCCHHARKLKPEAATAVIELLMMGVRTPETCWAVNKFQVIKPDRLLHLVDDLFELYDDART
jgi:hypothetical protein